MVRCFWVRGRVDYFYSELVVGLGRLGSFGSVKDMFIFRYVYVFLSRCLKCGYYSGLGVWSF